MTNEDAAQQEFADGEDNGIAEGERVAAEGGLPRSVGPWLQPGYRRLKSLAPGTDQVARSLALVADQWVVAVVFLALGTALILGSVRIPTAGFSLVAVTHFAALELGSPTLSEDLGMRNLIIVGVEQLSLAPGREIEVEAGDPTFSVEVRAPDDPSGLPLTVPSFSLQDVRIRIERLELGRYGLFLAPPPAGIEVMVPPGSIILPRGGTPIEISGRAPRALTVGGNLAGIELFFSLDDGEQLVLIKPPMLVTDLRLWKAEPTLHRREIRSSGIQSGRLSFLDLPNRNHDLHPGDDLDITLEQGTLHSLTLSEGGIDLYLSGVADDLERRLVDSRRSQLPTWFDKLSKMSEVRAVVGLVTFFVGLGLHQKLRRRR